MYILFVNILFVNDIFCFGLFHFLSLATAITQCTCTWSFFLEFQIAIITARDYLFLKELDESIDYKINRTEYRQIRWKVYCIYDASNWIYIANIEKIGEIAIINVLLYISQLNQNGV